MRMSGVIIGGLLGAMAAMYFNRNGSFRWATSIGNAGQALDRVVDMARSRMMQPDNRSYYGGNASQQQAMNNSAMQSGVGSASGSGMQASAGMEQVKRIVKEDPELSKEVNKIMSESKDTSSVR